MNADIYDDLRNFLSDAPHPSSRFDWFIKSRTPEELRRRGQTLLLCLTKGQNQATNGDGDDDLKPSGSTKKGAAASNGNGNGSAAGKKRAAAVAAGTESRDGTPASTGAARRKPTFL